MTRLEDRDDQALIEQTLRGDSESFEVLMKRHANSVKRTVDSLLQKSNDKEDVIQEVMIKAWKHLSHFRGECTFRTWLIRVTINEGLATFRRRRSRPECQGEFDLLTAKEESPHEFAARREAAQEIRSASASLPKRYREVFILRDIKELNIDETAQELGLTESAVKARLFRARRMLATALGPELRMR